MGDGKEHLHCEICDQRLQVVGDMIAVGDEENGVWVLARIREMAAERVHLFFEHVRANGRCLFERCWNHKRHGLDISEMLTNPLRGLYCEYYGNCGGENDNRGLGVRRPDGTLIVRANIFEEALRIFDEKVPDEVRRLLDTYSEELLDQTRIARTN